MNYQVVVLVGGKSSRFFPFNNLHKSFFTLAGKTIIQRTVENIKRMNPIDIILVLSSNNYEEEKKFCERIPSLSGVKYAVQESPLGQADAILSAEKFIKGNFFVVNAQQFLFEDIADKFVEAFDKNNCKAVIGSTETDTPSKYGILNFDGNRVIGIIEKPKPGMEPSNKRLVGVYLFSQEIFNSLRSEDISEYSLEIVLNKIAKEGSVVAVNIEKNLPSLKYPWDIITIKNQILTNQDSLTESGSIIEKTVVFKGKGIHIGKNAHIFDYAIIEGPAYIGDDAVVGAYSHLRGGTVLESGSQVQRYGDIKNSHIGKNSHIHSGFVGDSIIGSDVRIGAEFITANKRLDRGNIKVSVKDQKVDSDLTSLGVIIGNNVRIGIRVSTMPGCVIGSDSTIYPGVTVKGTVEENAYLKN